ncbi:hypothetical protein B0F90DRAFT_1742649 [Multifurca ochricompacta]|uniref:MIT domain-containing protein n=1 Tax=Multifurca ochricompacta TaxID=376703 RepID=A0AAD4M044_9AGAM|nr:hypothetical protein B0F90DRAFT_1742649 [Multifurca ochricompacta]
MSTPPPPYSLQPPPAYTRPRKPPCRPRPSSRQVLSEALQRAQHAVHLDSSQSDIPAAIAAYDEAILLLQQVIARRSRKVGTEGEVARVTAIHDRYVARVRELCQNRCIPLPSHVSPAAAAGTSSSSSSSLSPSSSSQLRPPPLPTSLHQPHRDRVPSPGPTPPSSPIRPHVPTPLVLDRGRFGKDDQSQETEWDSELSSPSSSSSPPTTATVSPASSVEDSQEVQKWITSEAREEELAEWGQYLEGGRETRRASVGTTTSSAVWSTIAVSHGDCA